MNKPAMMLSSFAMCFISFHSAAEAVDVYGRAHLGVANSDTGDGSETSIETLVDHVKEISNFKGEINWDTSKPSGQQRRLVDSSKAKQLFGFEATTKLEDGLNQEIQWLNNNP